MTFTLKFSISILFCTAPRAHRRMPLLEKLCIIISLWWLPVTIKESFRALIVLTWIPDPTGNVVRAHGLADVDAKQLMIYLLHVDDESVRGVIRNVVAYGEVVISRDGCEVTCHRLQVGVDAVCESSHTAVTDSVGQAVETATSVRPASDIPYVRPPPFTVSIDQALFIMCPP